MQVLKATSSIRRLFASVNIDHKSLIEYWSAENKWNLNKETLNTTCQLYVLIMSGTCFRVNPHSIVARMPTNSLHETGTISEA